MRNYIKGYGKQRTNFGNKNKFNFKSYAVVIGEGAYKLSTYSGTINLHVVLILTHQMAEQGIDLPRYNYVINYHI